MNTGTIFSGIGHAGLILWVLVGDWLFPARPADEIIVKNKFVAIGAQQIGGRVFHTDADDVFVVLAQLGNQR